MDSASFFIEPNELWALIGTGRAPQIVDTRRREVYDAALGVLPSATGATSPTSNAGRPNSTATGPSSSRAGSRTRSARWRRPICARAGFDARVLAGGYAAWSEAEPAAGRPNPRSMRFAPQLPSLWVTRRRPKIDRVACPWLIRRFLDPQARILFVDPADVLAVAQARPAPSRSTSKASKFRTKASAARSTPC